MPAPFNIWDSTRLFWNNRPAPGKVESENKASPAGLCQLDVTGFIKSAINDDTHNTEVYGLLASLKTPTTAKFYRLPTTPGIRRLSVSIFTICPGRLSDLIPSIQARNSFLHAPRWEEYSA